MRSIVEAPTHSTRTKLRARRRSQISVPVKDRQPGRKGGSKLIETLLFTSKYKPGNFDFQFPNGAAAVPVWDSVHYIEKLYFAETQAPFLTPLLIQAKGSLKQTKKGSLKPAQGSYI